MAKKKSYRIYALSSQYRERVFGDMTLAMDLEDVKAFRTQVIVKLEMLRGACNMPRIHKRKIAESIEEFIREIKNFGVADE